MEEGHFVSLPVISGWWHAQGKDHGKSINQTGLDAQKRFQLWSQRKLLEKMGQATQLYHEPKIHSLFFSLSIYPNLPLGREGSVSTICKSARYLKTQRSYSLSHSLTSTLNCCSAPIDTCLTSASRSSCSKEVDRCLQADIHAVCATFPCKCRDTNTKMFHGIEDTMMT